MEKNEGEEEVKKLGLWGRRRRVRGPGGKRGEGGGATGPRSFVTNISFPPLLCVQEVHASGDMRSC